MFANQIALSELPFPVLLNWAGQLGEISSGIVLLALLIFRQNFTPNIADKLFYFVNVLITIIMLVAIYVHLHPNVPAETLPLGTKPPYLTVFILMLVGLNTWLRRKNKSR